MIQKTSEDNGLPGIKNKFILESLVSKVKQSLIAAFESVSESYHSVLSFCENSASLKEVFVHEFRHFF